MKGMLKAAGVLALAAIGCGCADLLESPDADPVNMDLVVDPNPPRVGPSHLTVVVVVRGEPVFGARVEARAVMANAGMEPLSARFRDAMAGRYEAPFTWTMAGDWTMKVSAVLPSGMELARVFNIAVAAGDDTEHQDQPPQPVPDRDAIVTLLSPVQGMTLPYGNDVTVAVRCENFALGRGGRHWHIYVDGRPAKWVMDGTRQAVLHGLAPGKHEIAVYLAQGERHELAHGSAVTINVVEPNVADSTGMHGR